MTLTFQEFCDQLVENALMSEFGIAAVLSTQDHPPQTSDEFANLLIREKKLTKYQARMLLDGKGQSLTLGVYLIKTKLGRGGMGQVFLAEHMRMKRNVALKVLSPEFVKNSASVLRFHREVEAVAQLNHQNIVTAYDANEDNGTHFLVMEYIPGCDLATSVQRNGPFAVAQALDAIEQTAAGLAYAHERGVVHRDIKPSNLMLDSSGTIKILDLGLARIKSPGDESDQNDLTDPGMVMGTVDYMAPEQALDSRSADAVSDIYSLGCCLFYLLTGRSLFRESTAMQRLIALQNQPAPTLSENRSDIPVELEETYQKLIAKDPRERFQSMTEVIDAIRRCRTLVEAQPASSPALKEGEAQLLLYLDDAFRDSSEDTLENVTIPDSDLSCQNTVPTASAGDTEKTVSSSRRSGSTDRAEPESESAGGSQLLFGFSAAAAILILIGLALTNSASQNEQTPQTGGNAPRSAELPSQTTQGNASDPAGKYALQFDGVGDWVQLPHIDYPPDSPLTIELWYRSPEIQKNESGVLVFLNSIFSLKNTMHGNWRFVIADQGSDYIRGTLDEPQIVERFVHLAAIYEDYTVRLYLDGKRQKLNLTRMTVEGEGHTIEPFSGKINPRRTSPGTRSALGGYTQRVYTDPTIRGSIEELRISRVARYSSDFTPSKRFALDDDVLALYHFDEGNGDLLVDSSLNNYHGTIYGATWVNADGTPLATDDSPADPLPQRERKAAEWVIRNGGSVNLRGLAERFSSIDELPGEEFEIYHVHLASDGDLDPREFEHLAGLPKLEMVYLSGSKIDSTVIPHLAKIPRLMLLQIGGSQLPSSALAPLKSVRRLHFLAVEGGESVDDNWEAVRQLSSLRSITVFGGTQRDVRRLASIPHLRQIWLPRADSLDEETIAVVARLNPDCRLLIGRKNESLQVLGRDPVKELARALSELGARLKLNEVGSGASRQFDSPEIDQIFMLTILELPPNSRLDDSLRQKISVADLSYFSGIGQQDADGLAAALASQTLLTGVQFAKSDLTDEGLGYLARCPSLAYLDVRETQVTSAGIAAFQAARPDCMLFLDPKPEE